MSSILLLTHDTAVTKAVADVLPANDWALTVVDSASEAGKTLDTHRPVVLLVDLAVGADALSAARGAGGRRERVSIIAIADRRHPDAGSQVLRMGALDIVSRPVRKADLLAALAHAREFQGVTFRLSQLEALEIDDGFFASSPAMRSLRDVVQQVAPSRCAVMLVGERGTGKDMVARAIHRLSRMSNEPFVTIDCAYRGESPQSDRLAVADFEREIFEAVARPALDLRQAETVGDAGTSHRGGSRGSTVFLKRIDQMAPVVQGTLERLLVESGTEVGEERPLPVRLLTGARPEIAEAIERGRFRGDLFDRLSVVRLDLPPLRRRPQDVPLLATHFLKEACERHDAPPKVFSPAAQSLLAALPWRGNARELQHLTERLAVLVTRGVILQEDVLEHVLLEGTSPRGVPRGTLREARERFEREFIAGVLQRHRGRMAAAAMELGIERTNLYRKMKQLGVRWE